MFRASTPTHYFTLPDEIVTSDIDELIITYAQGEETVLEKRKDDVTIEGKEISFRLTQEEANKFAPGFADLQIRLKMQNGTVIASKIYRIKTEDVLNDEVM